MWNEFCDCEILFDLVQYEDAYHGHLTSACNSNSKSEAAVSFDILVNAINPDECNDPCSKCGQADTAADVLRTRCPPPVPQIHPKISHTSRLTLDTFSSKKLSTNNLPFAHLRRAACNKHMRSKPIDNDSTEMFPLHRGEDDCMTLRSLQLTTSTCYLVSGNKMPSKYNPGHL